MKILKIEPNKSPTIAHIDGSLESMQKVVDGIIQAIYPFEEPVALVCNDESKIRGMPFNRYLSDDKHGVYDYIAGTFFLCACPPDSDSFESLTEEQIRRYSKIFAL